jgi:hypothetical protein
MLNWREGKRDYNKWTLFLQFWLFNQIISYLPPIFRPPSAFFFSQEEIYDSLFSPLLVLSYQEVFATPDMAFYCSCGQRFDSPSQPCPLCLQYPSVWVESVVVKDAHSFKTMNGNRESYRAYSPLPPHSPYSPLSYTFNPPPSQRLTHSPPSSSPPHARHSHIMTTAATTSPEDTRVPSRSFSTMTVVQTARGRGGKLRSFLKALLWFRRKDPPPTVHPQIPTQGGRFSWEDSLHPVPSALAPLHCPASPPPGVFQLPADEITKTYELWAPPSK